jgi:plastocyanin
MPSGSAQVSEETHLKPLPTFTSLAVGVALVLGGCAVGSVADMPSDDDRAQGAVGDAVHIFVTNNGFTAASVEIQVGDPVVWTFDQGAHNVVFTDVESDVLRRGTWQRTFDSPGTYPYECTLHTGMDGEVVVQRSD